MALELQDTFDRARDEAAFKEHRQTMFVHQEGQNDSPDREGSAVILGSGGAARMATEIALRQAKDQESTRETQVLLAILNDRIAHWDTQIEIGTSFADDLANGELPVLTADGKIADDDREQFIKDYEERTGQTVDRGDLGSLTQAVDSQNDYIREQRQADAEQRASIDRSAPTYQVEAEAATEFNQQQGFRQQVGMQSDYNVSDEREIALVEEVLDYSVDEEVELFMQSYAEAQGLGPEDRLTSERTLVQGLSEEALEVIEFSEDTEHLFMDGYFDSLDDTENARGFDGQTIEAAQTLSEPSR